MKVTNKIPLYEVNGQEQMMVDRPQLIIESHWNKSRFVVLCTEGGQRVTVLAADLEKAIRNATNV